MQRQLTRRTIWGPSLRCRTWPRASPDTSNPIRPRGGAPDGASTTTRRMCKAIWKTTRSIGGTSRTMETPRTRKRPRRLQRVRRPTPLKATLRTASRGTWSPIRRPGIWPAGSTMMMLVPLPSNKQESRLAAPTSSTWRHKCTRAATSKRIRIRIVRGGTSTLTLISLRALPVMSRTIPLRGILQDGRGTRRTRTGGASTTRRWLLFPSINPAGPTTSSRPAATLPPSTRTRGSTTSRRSRPLLRAPERKRMPRAAPTRPRRPRRRPASHRRISTLPSRRPAPTRPSRKLVRKTRMPTMKLKLQPIPPSTMRRGASDSRLQRISRTSLRSSTSLRSCRT
mmetsp:Transcript_13066/g.31930  ORF Transcript_13066/g.31930 Transcript_13066/m.31930 type:complete len:339 (+) Transcript_13066:1300-2316(+)